MLEYIMFIIGDLFLLHQGYTSAKLLKQYNLGYFHATLFYGLDAVLLFFVFRLVY